MQAEGTLAHDFDSVVEQADDAQSHEEEDEEHPGPRWSRACDKGSDEPREDRRQDDDDTAHRRRAALGQVLRRPVLADELPVLVHHQESDEQRRAHHGQRHRDNERGNESNHRVVPFSRRMSATCHDCEP